VSFLFVGCGPLQSELDTTVTQVALDASTAQATPASTPTPAPTPTATATPTNTTAPIATHTPAPLPSPVPSPTPGPPPRVIVVTTASDAANGDTTTVDTLIANPGLDGISLREAIAASNNTSGPERIEFAPELAKDVIFVGSESDDNMPFLTGGGLTISGDVDGDGEPDIIIDGSRGMPDGPTSNCFSIWSDNNTIVGLILRSFHGTAVGFGVPHFHTGGGKTLSGNSILRNTISARNGIGIGPSGWIGASGPELVSDLTWQNTVISGNHITAPTSINLQAGSDYSQHNLILNTTIVDNVITGLVHLNGGFGTPQYNSIIETTIESNLFTGDGDVLLILAGVGAAQHNRILSTTIRSNVFSDDGGSIVLHAADTNSAWIGMPGSVRYADGNVLENVVISDNKAAQIKIHASNMGNRGNQVRDIRIIDNQVGWGGIFIATASQVLDTDGRVTSDNSITDVEIRGNIVEGAELGIYMGAGGAHGDVNGPGLRENSLERITIADNTVLGSEYAGIILWGGMLYGNSHVTENTVRQVTISGNQVLAHDGAGSTGILIVGGWMNRGSTGSVATNSITALEIVANEIVGYDVGIQVIGGNGTTATGNSIEGQSFDNLLLQNTLPFELLDNQAGALDNVAKWDSTDME
jgi:hypothetical protein